MWRKRMKITRADELDERMRSLWQSWKRSDPDAVARMDDALDVYYSLMTPAQRQAAEERDVDAPVAY